MVNPEPASLPCSGQARDQRPLRTLREAGHHAQGQEQRPRLERGRRRGHRRRKHGIAQPSDPHRPFGAEAIAPPPPREARRRSHDVHRGPQERHHGHCHTELLRPEDDEGFRHAEEIEEGDGEKNGR